MSMKAVVQQIGQHANKMPLERGLTLPMVKLENKHVIVRRLIYFTRTTLQHGTAITQPQYVASYDLSNAAFIGLEKFESEMEVLNLQPPPWIHNRPGFEKPEDILSEFERIWTLYDILIPAFIRAAAGIDADIKQAAKAYRRYFDRHAEKPLLPYYEVFGGVFLRWVEDVSDP